MRHIPAFVRALAAVCLLSLLIRAQSLPTGPKSDTVSQASPSPQQPAATLHRSTRMVTLEVVARDHHGKPIFGLSASDFEVFEQIASKRERHPQKIAAFRAVSVADLAVLNREKLQFPDGVYTNVMTLRKIPVPPTVLLIDGLNTEPDSQMRVHQQMVHLLASIPEDVPVAVFLLGRRLKLIQGFTTDPKLLRATLQKISIDHAGSGAQFEPQDDPDATSAFVEGEPNVPAASLTSLEQFEREVYAMQVDIRVQETIDALRTLARHLAGYPGRKNLLWISSSFPIAITPDVDLFFAGVRNYQDQVAKIANALADAKIAIYPMDAGGLQVQSSFQASTRMRGNLGYGRNSVGRRIEREDQSRFSRQAAMQSLADQTGGIICVNDNDLGDCVRKAVNDGSSFYEIAYYPDSRDWQGEFHKITVKSTKPGVRLAYRQGYFARVEQGSDQKSKDLQEAGCQDYLTSTSLLMVVKQYPGDKPGEAKFLTALYPSTLTFVQQEDGSRNLALKFAVCMFDAKGKPLQFMHQDFDAKLTDKQYAEIQAQHGLPHTVVITPTPETVAVRLLVEDLTTGQIGSVNMPYTEVAAQTTPPPANPGAATQAVH